LKEALDAWLPRPEKVVSEIIEFLIHP
jgi:hypothetical protein